MYARACVIFGNAFCEQKKKSKFRTYMGFRPTRNVKFEKKKNKISVAGRVGVVHGKLRRVDNNVDVFICDNTFLYTAFRIVRGERE